MIWNVAVLSCESFTSILVIGEFPIPNINDANIAAAQSLQRDKMLEETMKISLSLIGMLGSILVWRHQSVFQWAEPGGCNRGFIQRRVV
jgi:hypothetical protein